MEIHAINKKDLKRDPAKEGALNENGELQILDASFWQQFSQIEISNFCVANAFYCIPTTELVLWLQERIAGHRTIEIGSGNGVMAKRLGIPATDNRMQEWPKIAIAYEAVRQRPIKYGDNVICLDAQAAVEKYKPELVIAAWVTHKWNPKDVQREGNMYGVTEEDINKNAAYIHIGNRYVHRDKPILDLPHEEYEFPWLISRAINGSPNFIAVWE